MPHVLIVEDHEENRDLLRPESAGRPVLHGGH